MSNFLLGTFFIQFFILKHKEANRIIYFINEMEFDFLPIKISTSLSNVNMDNLYEIRLRIDAPIVLNYNNEFMFLSENGLTLSKNYAVICKNSDIEFIVNQITEFSIYSFNEQIKNGYLTTKDGVRIGISGECVFEKDKLITIKNFSSLNIRIPHNVIGCGKKVFENIFSNGIVQNTLIISRAGYGKTTILKDLVRLITGRVKTSILLIDERAELSVNLDNCYVDVIKFCNKQFAFDYGVRTLSPRIVITDELSTENDWQCVNSVINSGVKIIASCHGNSLQDIKKKKFFKNVFDKYVLLNGEGKVGQIKEIYLKDNLND